VKGDPLPLIIKCRMLRVKSIWFPSGRLRLETRSLRPHFALMYWVGIVAQVEEFPI